VNADEGKTPLSAFIRVYLRLYSAAGVAVTATCGAAGCGAFFALDFLTVGFADALGAC
jgi:hypothetical protein